ncbi:hypothetical protein B296_00055909 [Ensete ventricosum]|uniref:Uncharacterized protein n=1 Tax=Ensete ventricosum TaxID=4639 RepID=A0A426X9Q9_ENSVE|nr:hypothetical protein B296_00055909 [Ensete ventricosum]
MPIILGFCSDAFRDKIGVPDGCRGREKTVLRAPVKAKLFSPRLPRYFDVFKKVLKCSPVPGPIHLPTTKGKMAPKGPEAPVVESAMPACATEYLVSSSNMS